jgi:hypothetical protein
MKYIQFSKLILIILIITQVNNLTPVFSQEITLEQIKTNLLNNPPNTGDSTVRDQTIIALDNILKEDSSRTSQSVFDFYTFMMEKVEMELQDKVEQGAVIWMMYNDGFIIKTPQVIFAFDLVEGYSGWSMHLPSEIIKQIKVLFISHQHGDHYNKSVADTVMAYGGYVVVPSEDSYMGNVPMATGDSLTILGLQIKAHYGLHSVPVRIFEINCPDGLTFLHTGDNQTSETLPDVSSLEVLLLNAWVNESGSSTAIVGMRNSISRLNPKIMIPGHIQDLGHDYTPGDPTSRVPYEWALSVDDVPITAKLRVMVWGERYYIQPEEIDPIIINKETELVPDKFKLYQNFPNPFNRSTYISYFIARAAHVNLIVYDILGQKIRILVDKCQKAGDYTVSFDARDLASGIYLYKLQVGDPSKNSPTYRSGQAGQGFVLTKKMLLMR